MRDPARIDPFLEEFGAFWKRHPDWRFCQIIGNLFRGDPYYVYDEMFLDRLRNYEKGEQPCEKE